MPMYSVMYILFPKSTTDLFNITHVVYIYRKYSCDSCSMYEVLHYGGHSNKAYLCVFQAGELQLRC